jgi:hypothetical protein
MATIPNLIKALRDPTHPLHKKIAKQVEELIAQTREDTAKEIITALESGAVTVNCGCGCWENFKAKFIKPKKIEPQNEADIPERMDILDKLG